MPRLTGLALAPALLLFAFLLPAAAVLAQESGSPMILPVDPAPLVATTGEGDVRFQIEVADTPEERSRGLMFRERMPENQGMLFVFPQSLPVGFWMKNTILPLDLLFVSDKGEVRAILQGVPFSTDTISPGEAVRFVLELNAGTAERQGISVGDRLSHPIIDAVGGG
ncbi:DUF192 domain-containing protein [Aquibium microcysteis]|uniref:DUF192 domain-containing protein n=1 Tax=Aquibium microcysteis TaxID=675281 RepID=UPI00165D0F80|nr:DUF192 domain-containing protein [Aquibium microcysteis]